MEFSRVRAIDLAATRTETIAMEDPESVAVLSDDESLSHYPRLLGRLLGVPIAVVSVGKPRWGMFSGAPDVPGVETANSGLSAAHPLCTHVGNEGLPLIVYDARTDARVVDNPVIANQEVASFAGWPLQDESGRSIGALCVADTQARRWTIDNLADLADLAQACSAELQQSELRAVRTENLTRAIFDAVDVAMAFYDADDRLVLANGLAREAADLAGFALDVPPHAGDEVRAADNETRIPHREQLVPRALRGEQVGSATSWVGPPGRQMAVYGSWSPVLHADGTRWGTLVAAHDVTRLARALQVKDDFIGTVAHELLTPLTSLIAHLELVSDDLAATPGPVSEAMAVVGRNVNDLHARIDELVSTADRRRIPDLRSTDIAGLTRGVAQRLGQRASDAGIGLAVRSDGEHWAEVDPRRVTQAVQNLVVNAIKFTGPAGHIRVGVSGTRDEVRIVVADTGCGMTFDEIAQACDLFWKAESTHRSAARGLGIGLTFVRDTVTMHGGHMHIESQPASGTTVTLAFPREFRRTAPGVTPTGPKDA